LQNFGGEWKAVGNEIVGVSESMYGNSAPSGTAWRQVEALLNESHSLFELMTENKGLCIERMMREFIIPHIKKKMDTAEEIGAILDGYQLQKIDTKYVPAEATKRLSKKLINQIIATGDVPEVTGGMVQAEVDGVKEELDMQGNQRFFKPDDIEDVTWKQVFDKLEWELEVDVTGEQSDNKSDMATLSTLFQTVVSKQGQPFTPEEKMVFDKILVKSNTVSPIELTTIPTQAKTAPQSPPTGEMGATL
jgi:hypothetical protein